MARKGMFLVFGESDSQEYKCAVLRVSNAMDYVSLALRVHTRAEAEQRLRELMPHPIKSIEALDLLCPPILLREILNPRNLVSHFNTLGALEKELAPSGSKYPVLLAFLVQRHLVARHFLMAPMLATKAAEVCGRWKLEKGFRKHQSWVFLEHSEQDARQLIPRLLPRASQSRSTAELARLMDGVERLAEALGGYSIEEKQCSMEELKSCGIYSEEWASDDALVSAALELIYCKAKREGRKRITPRRYVYDAAYSIEDCERCLELFKPLREPHPPRQLSIRLIAMKLLEHYVEAGHAHPDIPLKPIQLFQRREQLQQIHHMLNQSADMIGVRVHKVMCSHIEDLLEDAVELLEAQEVCECCKPSFKAIVECARAFSAPLAKTRLPMLAREVLRNWKGAGDLNTPWTEIPEAPGPFPAPILEEIETYAARDMKTGCRMRWSAPAPLERVVAQFWKAKTHGIAEQHEHYEDPVLRTSVEVLEMAEVQIRVEHVLQAKAAAAAAAAEEEARRKVVKAQESESESELVPELEQALEETVKAPEAHIKPEVEQAATAEGEQVSSNRNTKAAALDLDKLVSKCIEMGLVKLPPMAMLARAAATAAAPPPDLSEGRNSLSCVIM